jgi:glycosyltransferase involved in cell wall biosynthesis
VTVQTSTALRSDAVTGSPSDRERLRVLLVPDSIYWVTGTIAASFARHNSWMQSAIISGPVLDDITHGDPVLADRFDIVHFVCPYAAREWLEPLRSRVPVVTSHHHVTDWEAVRHNLQGDCIVAGSTEWAEDIIARGADPDRVVCIPYGVDADRFSPVSVGSRRRTRNLLGLSDEGPVVGFFGKRGSNDDDRKGTDIFVDAIMELKRTVNSTQVLIVGPGWHELVREFRQAGINCAWIPFAASLDELAPLHGALDFYWVTARVEGGPVPLLEAMSTGIACLTTPVGLARDIVDDSNAIMLPKGIASPFAEMTAELWFDPNRRSELGRRARDTILQRMQDRDTSREVYRAYEIASRFFAERVPHRRPIALARQSWDDAGVATATVQTDPPLQGIPASLHRKIRMLESLAWAENLILYQQQRTAALSLIWRAWRANPTSLLPARTLLRRFLPVTLVKSVVQLKRTLRSRTRSLRPSQDAIKRS